MTPRAALAALVDDLRRQSGMRLPAALALQVLGSIADGIGILMIIPLTAVVSGRGALISRLPGGAVFDGLDADGRLFLVCSLFLGVMALRAGLMTARDRSMASLSSDYLASLKARALAGLAGRGWRTASASAQADMQRLLLAGSDRLGTALYALQSLATSAILLFVQGILALALAPLLTLTAALMMLMLVAVTWPWMRRSQRRGERIGAALDEASQSAFLLHAGLKTALAEGEAERFVEHYRASERRLAEEWTKLAVIHARTNTVTSIVTAVAVVVLLIAGRIWLGLPLEVLLPMLLLFARLNGPAQAALSSTQMLMAHGPSFREFVPFLDVPAPIVDPARQTASLEWRRLEVKSLVVSPDGDHAIGPFDVTIEHGRWIAISGPSGCGKTTLIDTIAGLMPPMNGALVVDGETMTLVRHPGWAASIAYVAQQEPMFHETLRSALGDPARWAGDFDTVAMVTGLDKVIAALPSGLDTRLGDKAARLSGGQRQRVALARALLRGPRLLILDEATSALDPAAEAGILERLRALPGRPALLLISHRPVPDLFDEKIDLATPPLTSR